MTRDIEGELLQKRAIKSAKMSNEELIDEAKKIFSRRKMVWIGGLQMALQLPVEDRKSTRLNSSH